jgi:hypothetical protein
VIHAIAYILFILPFTAWLGHELQRKYSLRTYWKWALGAFLIGIAGSIVSNVYAGKTGNFILHASGGISSVLLFVYTTKTLRLRFSWSITTLLLFAFVCSLGVLNELAEYAIELLGLETLSYDTHDTWRDFVANTTGATITWGIYSIIRRLKSGEEIS